MKLSEVLIKLSDVTIDQTFVRSIETKYNAKLTDEVKKIISLNADTVFYDDKEVLRGLSNSEILNATEDLQVDLICKSLLPVFDTGDNDFIVFDLSENCWYLFNIVDEVKFKKATTISEYL